MKENKSEKKIRGHFDMWLWQNEKGQRGWEHVKRYLCAREWEEKCK